MATLDVLNQLFDGVMADLDSFPEQQQPQQHDYQGGKKGRDCNRNRCQYQQSGAAGGYE